MTDFVCVRCGSVKPRLTWQIFENKTAHIRLSCGDCGLYSRYVPMTEKNLAAVEGGPVPPGGPVR